MATRGRTGTSGGEVRRIRASRSASEVIALLRWGLFVAGLILFALLYSAFLNWAAIRTAESRAIDGWVWLFVVLPPVQLAFIAGGGIAARLAKRQRLAFRWCAILLVSFVILDGLINLYYGIGSCLVIC